MVLSDFIVLDTGLRNLNNLKVTVGSSSTGMTIKTIRHKDYKCHAGLDPASRIKLDLPRRAPRFLRRQYESKAIYNGIAGFFNDFFL